MVEIDTQVIDVAKQYSSTAAAFKDAPLTLIHDTDGFDYMQTTCETFDVIIADALDPIGPGETIFTPDFYECMYKALNNCGVACVQSECVWINLSLICDVLHYCNEIFDYAEYATANIPCFPCGQTGFVLGRKGYSYSCQHPVRLPSEKLSSQLKWYNPAIHTAAFQLPEFDKASHVGNRGEQGDGCVVGGCNIL